MIKGEIPIEPLVKQVDYYIVGNSRDERPYLFSAVRNGVEVIGTMTNIDEIFNAVILPEKLVQFKADLTSELTKNLFEKFPPHEYEYFLFHNGTGECLTFFFWMKEYRKYTDKKILAVCTQKIRFELMNICPYVDQAILVNDYVFNFISIYFSDCYNIKNFWKMYQMPRVIEENGSLPPQIRYDGIRMEEYTRAFLGIDSGAKFERYPVNIPDEITENVSKFFDESGLKRGKTVFLSISGLWFSTALQDHHAFWLKLVATLRNEGYEVVTNGQTPIISGVKNIFLSLVETSAFIGLCGNVISIATGFVEAACALNNADNFNAVFIYAGKNDAPWRGFVNNTFAEICWLEEFQYRGSKLAEVRTLDYKPFMEKFCDKNVKINVHTFGDNANEDDELILRIVTELEN